jgi:hypothetical protein
MSEKDDIDALAGEYVLGSLDGAERAAVEARRKADAALDGAITAWERRLGPLSEREPGIEPSGHLRGRILARISAQPGGAPRAPEMTPLLRLPRHRRVRWIAAGAALAACLALAVAWLSHPHVGQFDRLQHAGMDCGRLYKDFWDRFDREALARVTADGLAEVSRVALRAYNACAAGDEQNAAALFDRLRGAGF